MAPVLSTLQQFRVYLQLPLEFEHMPLTNERLAWVLRLGPAVHTLSVHGLNLSDNHPTHPQHPGRGSGFT